MTASPIVYATISVTSGCLCFGSLHNIWSGATTGAKPSRFPTARPRLSGTVKSQPIEFNIVARNGTWNAYQLIDLMTKEVAAWLVTHSDVDPLKEIDKILRVSGSPYEPDSGSVFNDEKTAQNAVFVINRYDWGWYDNRSKGEVVVPEELDGERTLATIFEAAGLVDLAVARSMVLQWKEQRSSERTWSDGAAWLHIPGGEYMFGRFGFDDDRTAARSFLFFTTNTYFTRTAFDGMGQTIRKEESPAERFERRLREGYDFSGLETLREISRPPEPGLLSLSPLQPPRADCLGPYDKIHHVLRAQEINAIRVYRIADEPKNVLPGGNNDLAPFRMSTPISDFIDPWAEPVYDVLNEMVLSYLQRTAIPRMGNQDVRTAAETLFPRHDSPDYKHWLDVWGYRHFTQPDRLPIPNFDTRYVLSRIKSFLSRFGDPSVLFADECVAGITRVVACMLTEVLDMANRLARGGLGDSAKIMPGDVRMAVYNEPALLDRLQFSRVYWEGRDPSLAGERQGMVKD